MVAYAAREVGYTSTAFMHKVRREDEDFADAWDLAVQAAGDRLEEAAVERAVNGVMEPQYYKGHIVGYTPRFSDSLLMFVLKKIRPEYRDSGGHGAVNVNVGVAVMPQANKSADVWEANAKIMHSEQKTITLEETKEENVYAAVRTGRGD
jgi:hypothetical protein